MLYTRAPLRLAAAVLAVSLLGATGGLAFAGWMEHAPGIMMTLAETGLSWCF
jgi:hypothetical protein